MAYNTIKLKGPYQMIEGTASGAITPGHLLIQTSTAGTYAAHNAAGGSAVEKIFAVEQESPDADITTAYATTARFLGIVCQPGAEVYALLANGETAVIGSKLESQGDGTLRVVDADASAGAIAVQSIVGIALEAVDMSGSSGVDPSGRIRIRII